jgi:serine/threonine protein kinase
MITSGTRLGPYEIASLLGSGGMGDVYRARDPRLGREVAIKVLPAAVSTDSERRRRFELEARAAAALNHPHICQVYDVGPDYLVMEYIDGTPLQGVVIGNSVRLSRLGLAPPTDMVSADVPRSDGVPRCRSLQCPDAGGA